MLFACMLYLMFTISSPNTKICVAVIQYNKSRSSGKYLLIYNLFNDAASNLRYVDNIAPNFRIIVNDELKGMSKEITIAQFEALAWHLRGRTEGIH
jgi:hypothetical protein